jgi:8-oxo-dGTP diphosphatase
VITFLVRHGDAGDKRSWGGPDVARPLSPTGFRQAEGLVVRLDDYLVERILCSPTLRCHQTVQPLARDRLRLRIEPVAALGVDADPTEILELFWDQRLSNAVLCTHGETIGWLFVQLAARGLVVPGPLRWPKGSTWLLHRTDRGQVHARYLSPLPLDLRMRAG